MFVLFAKMTSLLPDIDQLLDFEQNPDGDGGIVSDLNFNWPTTGESFEHSNLLPVFDTLITHARQEYHPLFYWSKSVHQNQFSCSCNRVTMY